MKTLGIDIGTTTISAVVMDTEKRELLESRTLSNESFIKTDREWERIQDASILVKKAKDVLDELLKLYPDTKAIGLTGQMHGIVYLNREGQGISPLYTWQDGRGDLPEFQGETLVSWIQKNYEIPAATGYGLVTHLYHCKKDMVPEGSVSICMIFDYLGMQLTGRRTPLMHASNAASLGFYDTRKGEFRREMLEDAGIDLRILPEVTEACETLGTYQGIPVTAGLGDNQASFLGSVGMQEHVWQLNVGTGGQLSVLSDRHFETDAIEARPFLDGKYLLTGSVLCAGRAYAILEKFFRECAFAMGLGEQAQYEMMEKLAMEADKEAGGIRVVTAFQGTRVNPELRGSISGISEENFSPRNLIMGVNAGIAREYYDLYQEIYKGTGIHADKLVASGNGVRRNRVLQETLKQTFGAELVLTPFQEEAACGAALSAVRAVENSN